MPNNNTLSDTIARRTMTLFLLVDTSGSMTINGNIDRVNAAIEEMIPLLQEVSDENADAEIKIAVLEFSTGCSWVTQGAESLEGFFWNDLEASGLTDMGTAFIELESKLSRSSFLQSTTGAYAPVIILLSDGQPTDNIQSGLDKLRKNNWYRHATKIAIAVDDGDSSALAAFTGTTETVLKVNSDRDNLKKLLCRLAVVSSTMQSRSKTADIGDVDETAPGTSASDMAVSEDAAKGAIGQTVATLDPNDLSAPPAIPDDPWKGIGW